MKTKIKKQLTIAEAGRKEGTTCHICSNETDSAVCKSASQVIFLGKVQEGKMNG